MHNIESTASTLTHTHTLRHMRVHMHRSDRFILDNEATRRHVAPSISWQWTWGSPTSTFVIGFPSSMSLWRGYTTFKFSRVFYFRLALYYCIINMRSGIPKSCSPHHVALPLNRKLLKLSRQIAMHAVIPAYVCVCVCVFLSDRDRRLSDRVNLPHARLNRRYTHTDSTRGMEYRD